MKYKLLPRFGDFSDKDTLKLFICRDAARRINPIVNMDAEAILSTRAKNPKKKGWKKVIFSKERVGYGKYNVVQINGHSYSSFYDKLKNSGLSYLCENNATLWVKLENV